MPSLWFIMPAHGRENVARACMRQLARTIDELADHGIQAAAVVIAQTRARRDLRVGADHGPDPFALQRAPQVHGLS